MDDPKVSVYFILKNCAQKYTYKPNLSGVARNWSWGVQIYIFTLKILFTYIALMYKKFKNSIISSALRFGFGLGGCKCPIAPPLATLLPNLI